MGLDVAKFSLRWGAMQKIEEKLQRPNLYEHAFAFEYENSQYKDRHQSKNQPWVDISTEQKPGLDFLVSQGNPGKFLRSFLGKLDRVQTDFGAGNQHGDEAGGEKRRVMIHLSRPDEPGSPDSTRIDGEFIILYGKSRASTL